MMENENSNYVSDNNTIDNNNNNSIRESLIKTAVKFLQNPRVITSPLKHKQDFLKSKGLTNDEIKKAFELSSIAIPNDNQLEFSTVTVPSIYSKTNNSNNILTLLYKIKKFFETTTSIGVSIYCVYWIYKKFIKPFIFSDTKNESTMNDYHNNTITKSIIEMKESIIKMEDNVNKIMCNNLPDTPTSHLIQELKQDLASLKGLLLSRKQFPNAPPSIPPWQLEAPSQSREKTVEREDDAASGSSTNNSDSSLEMIREEPPK